MGMEALICYARIPGDTRRQLNCLEAVFCGLNQGRADDDFRLGTLLPVAQSGIGRDALICYARIPSDIRRRLNCLEAVFHGLNPDRADDDFSLGTLLPITQSSVGREALICYARIPTEDTEKQLACWEACVIARYGEGWYNRPEQITRNETLVTCFLNITRSRFFKHELDGMMFQNGVSVNDVYLSYAG
jgi:hypothetical protein